MGGNGSKVGDIFYPDNPKRRERAAQLRDDVQNFCNEFNEIKKHRDQVLQEIKPRLAELLKKQGYNSPDELDQAVRKILKGPALEEYARAYKQLNKADEVVETVFQITSIISVATGVFLGVLVVLSVMTGGAALAVIEAVGLALGIIAGATFLIVGIWGGSEERSNMRECINNLSFERVAARAALEGMKAISNWVEHIKAWLDEPLIIDNPELMKRKLEGDFKADFDKSKRHYVVKYLTQRDYEFSAWTNEDPDWKSGPEDILGAEVSATPAVRMIRMNEGNDIRELRNDVPAKIRVAYKNEKESGTLALQFMSNDEKSCTALDLKANDQWTITYESGEESKDPEGKPLLENFRFAVKNLATGKLLEGCQLTLLATTTS